MALFTGNIKDIKSTLALAYGEHVASGTVVQKASEGSGNSVQTTLVVLLGEGPWDSCKALYWAGDLIDPSNYHFHRGELATSMATATQYGDGTWNQGVDPWIQGGQTYSGTAYIVVKLPLGITTEDDFSKLKGVFKCLKVNDYDDEGNVIGFSYSTNPARVWADLVIVRRGLEVSRINWESWHDWKEFCELDINWVGGTVSGRPLWTNFVNTSAGADGAVVKSSGSNGWNAGATTTQFLPEGVDGFFEADVADADLEFGFTNIQTINTQGQIKFGFRFGKEANNFGIYHDGIYRGVVGGFVTGDRFRVNYENGNWSYYKNGVIIPTSYSAETVTSFPLYGGVAFYLISDEILRSSFKPMSSGARTRERLEAGIAFSSATDISSAIEAVLLVSCSNIQEVNGKFSFLPPATVDTPREQVYTFDMSNIVENSFSANRLARNAKPTRLVGKFRNLDDQYLSEDTVTVNRDQLVDIIGRVNDLGELPMGTMTRGQADVVTNYQMRMLSDLDLYSTLKVTVEAT